MSLEPRTLEKPNEAASTRMVSLGVGAIVLIAACNRTPRPPVLGDLDSTMGDSAALDARSADTEAGRDDTGPRDARDEDADAMLDRLDTVDAAVIPDGTDAAVVLNDGPRTDACGARGESCCQVSCQAGLACMGGRCLDIVQDCGASGRPCCILPAGVTNCNPGFGCAAGVCTVCGDEGQVCCTPDTGFRCRGTRGCFGGVCMTLPTECGRLNESCCNGSVCVSGTRCTASTGRCGMAPTCGERGLPCCASGQPCFAGICQSGMCLPPPITCGRNNQPCCTNDQCAVLYQCSAGVCRLRSPTCGDLGQPCCPEFDGCGSALLCASGQCIARTGICGIPGMSCCPVPMYPQQCRPGAVCRDGACQ